MASLKDSSQKANKKLKTQEALKTKDYTTDGTLTTPLYPLLLEYSQSTLL